MTYRIALSSFVDQTARNAAAAAQSTADTASATATTAAQNAATALIKAGTAQTAAGNALAVASARNHIFIQAAQPTTTTLDDLWVDTANGRILGWDGSAWTVRQLGTAGIAANAITANLIAANAVGANQIAATAIDGKTITGATLRTAASGKRVQIDSANGLIAYNSSGQAVTQIRTTDGVLIAAGAVITGELDTGATGTSRVRVYETIDGRGNPQGVIQLEDGVTGDTPATISANAYGGTYGGGGLAISGGKYGANPAAPTILLQTDQAALSQVQITAPDGLTLNGLQQLTQAGTVTVTPVANTPTAVSVTFPAAFAATPAVVACAITSGPGTAVVEVSVASVSKTGCSVWVNRKDTASTAIYWIAAAQS